MKKTILSVIVLMGFLKSLGQTPDAAAIRRIGDYGKLWAVLDLFHPQMAYGTINRDSLFADNIGDLLKDPSAANFKTAVQKMISRLGDGQTIIENESSIPGDSIYLPKRSLLRWLPDSIALLHIDLDFMVRSVDDFSGATLPKLIDSIKGARGLVLDFRKTKAGDGYSNYYESEFLLQLIGYITGRAINAPSFRTRIHYGHESQTFDMSSYYYQGWFMQNGRVIPVKSKAISKPVCLIVNRYNSNLSLGIAALQNGGVARVVADGVLKNFDPAFTYKMLLADGLNVAVRTGEVLYADGRKVFLPDAQFAGDSVTKEAILLQRATGLLQKSGNDEGKNEVRLQNLFAGTPVSGYDSLAYPPAPLRLLGLMRYWTAINYFCPNKDRITKNWDSVLYEYVPLFLGAKDSFAYMFAAARLIKELNDSHGWFGSKLMESLMPNVPPVQLRYVENKTIVYAVFNDSLKKKLATGDEIISVDGRPEKAVRDSIAQYISASNNASLQRDVTIRLLAGKENTSVKIGVLHKGRIEQMTLSRTGGIYDVAYRPRKGVIWKKIDAATGYVDLGRLEVAQIDSMFTDFKNTDAIIIDNRSYPRGTAWTLVNYLADKTVKAALGTTIIADSPDPLSSTAQNSIWEIPVAPKWKYKGRLIILVNETTQSQAEYTCMVLQAAAKNVTIIGSQTAGADGDVTGIKLPGGITTAFSGHGIHYPDGRPTQGIGIVPDINVKPTVNGMKNGRDEVLERALQFAKTGK